MTDTERLARLFSVVLRSWLPPEQMAEVIRRNALPGNERFCASHDFCDANMAMVEAFRVVFERDNQAESDADTDAINDAWDMAKANHFYPEE